MIEKSRKAKQELRKIELTIKTYSQPYGPNGYITSAGLMSQLEELYPEGMKLFYEKQQKERWGSVGAKNEEEYEQRLNEIAKENGWL